MLTQAALAEEPPATAQPDQEASPLETLQAAIVRPEPLNITRPDLGQIAPPTTAVEIVVELQLQADGSVSAASLVSGLEPYASATLKEASHWTFKPATRDGAPVPAKIQFLLTFSPVEAAPPSAPALQEVPPAHVPTKVVGEVLEEVVILGEIADPGATEITRLEVNNLAGTFGDPLRAVESMPGVTPIASGLPLFFVRGAPPANVGYFIDGIRVPLLYHAFLGPSVLHPAMLQKVSLSAGPMAAQYGRYAGAAVEAHLSEVDERKVEASVRLIDVGAFAQSRFASERGYVQLSGRYSYTGLLISLFAPGTRLDYWDYQGRVGYRVGAKDEVSVMTLGAYDYVGSKGEVVGGTEYHRVDLRWEHDFTKNDQLRTALTWGKDRTRSSVGTVKDNLWGARLNFEHSTPKFKVRSGTDVWLDQYELELDPSTAEPENYLELFPTRTDVSGGVFVDFVLAPSKQLRVIPGVRADHYTSLGKTLISVDPRLSAEYELTPRLTATHSIGTAHQTPNFVPNVPGAQVAGLDGGLQSSLQAAAKYEYAFPIHLNASVALYVNGTRNLTDPIGLGQSFSIDETSADRRAQGRAFGVEFYLKRPLTRRLGGFISYTYSKTLRSFGSISTPAGYDRPHVLNAAVSYNFGWGLRGSLKFALASGLLGRRTTLDGFVFDGSRSAPYYRLDVKIEKRFYPNPHLNWGIVAEVLNATYTGSVTTRTCGPEGCSNSGTAPITFPSLGVDLAWQ